MPRLDCDTCEFKREPEDTVTAYAAARDHEAANPDHWVIIEELD